MLMTNGQTPVWIVHTTQIRMQAIPIQSLDT